MTQGNGQRQPSRTGLVAALLGVLAIVAIVVVCGGAVGIWWLSGHKPLGPDELARRFRQEHKWVVATASVTVEVTEKSSVADWWEWAKTKISRTILRVKVSECKVQYIVPLDDLGTADVVDDPATKRLIVTVPYPQLDRNIVSIPADPIHWSYETTGGWLRWDKGNIDAKVRKELEQSVLEAAQKQGLDRGDELAAMESVEKLISGILRSSGDERTVKVEFRR